MFKFERFAKVATASVGALVLSTLSVTAAVGPVRAADVERVVAAAAVSDMQAHG